jgi:hypothetical protein
MKEISKHTSVLPQETLEFRDMVEVAMLDMIKKDNFVPVVCPLKHKFKDEVYERTITMFAGNRILSQIHKTQHPFKITKGKCIVWTFTPEGVKKEILTAPYKGTTTVGTLRILQIIKKTVWTTYHKCSKGETVQQIGDRIIEKHENKLLSSHHDLIERIMNGEESNIAITN